MTAPIDGSTKVAYSQSDRFKVKIFVGDCLHKTPCYERSSDQLDYDQHFVISIMVSNIIMKT